MHHWIYLTCVINIFCIYSVTAKEPTKTNLQNTDSTSHARYKRYHYPKPQIWSYESSSFNQEFTYNNPQNQRNVFPNGYQYDRYETNIPNTETLIAPYQQRQEPSYQPFKSESKFETTQVEIVPSIELTYSRLPEDNNPVYFNPQHSPNEEAGGTQLPLKPTVEERLAIRTMGDNQGAFINSNIFGSDFDGLNFTVSPTGLLIEVPEGGIGGGGGGADDGTVCKEPYKKPQMPNFRAAGRRISDIKCYEYIWELRTRFDKETRDMRCKEARSKRSQESRFQQEYASHETVWSRRDNLVKRQNKQIEPSNSDNNNTKTTEKPMQYFSGGGGFGETFKDAEAEEFPHMAAIGWRGITEEYVFKCGGSLISHKFVLTVAHCTASGPDPSIADIVPRIVRIGDTNIGLRADGSTFTQQRRRRQARDPGRVDVSIINIIKHDQYDPNVKYFDIALLELEYELEFNKHLQPACLWSDPNTSGRIKKAVAAGWGIFDPVTSRTTSDLQVGELDIIDTPTCNRLLRPSFGRKFSQVVNHQICAGKLSGGSDVCQGDSGGPLQVKIQLPIKTQGSMHTILGIISAGVGCAKPNTPGVYTRVTSFLNWIEEYVWP